MNNSKLEITNARREIQHIQTRILEMLSEIPGGELINNQEYRELRERLTNLQNLVNSYEIEQIFGYRGYPVQYCRCALPEVSMSNRQYPARCLNCGRAVPEFLVEREEEECDYRREIVTFIAFIFALALFAYLFLTGGILP